MRQYVHKHTWMAYQTYLFMCVCPYIYSNTYTHPSMGLNLQKLLFLIIFLIIQLGTTFMIFIHLCFLKMKKKITRDCPSKKLHRFLILALVPPTSFSSVFSNKHINLGMWNSQSFVPTFEFSSFFGMRENVFSWQRVMGELAIFFLEMRRSKWAEIKFPLLVHYSEDWNGQGLPTEIAGQVLPSSLPYRSGVEVRGYPLLFSKHISRKMKQLILTGLRLMLGCQHLRQCLNSPPHRLPYLIYSDPSHHCWQIWINILI